MPAPKPAWRDSSPFKVEFWSAISGKDRKHRSRFYKDEQSMLAAGRRWEQKDPKYWCRYWNGPDTWVSLSKIPKEKRA